MAILTFGKHKGLDLSEVARADPGWIAWACLTTVFDQFLEENGLWVKVVLVRPGRGAEIEFGSINEN
jgi:hypothetical protein